MAALPLQLHVVVVSRPGRPIRLRARAWARAWHAAARGCPGRGHAAGWTRRRCSTAHGGGRLRRHGRCHGRLRHGSRRRLRRCWRGRLWRRGHRFRRCHCRLLRCGFFLRRGAFGCWLLRRCALRRRLAGRGLSRGRLASPPPSCAPGPFSWRWSSSRPPARRSRGGWSCVHSFSWSLSASSHSFS